MVAGLFIEREKMKTPEAESVTQNMCPCSEEICDSGSMDSVSMQSPGAV